MSTPFYHLLMKINALYNTMNSIDICLKRKNNRKYCTISQK